MLDIFKWFRAKPPKQEPTLVPHVTKPAELPYLGDCRQWDKPIKKERRAVAPTKPPIARKYPPKVVEPPRQERVKEEDNSASDAILAIAAGIAIANICSQTYDSAPSPSPMGDTDVFSGNGGTFDGAGASGDW